MTIINYTHTIYTQEKAADLIVVMNANEDDDWTYIAENNPNVDGPKTAIIKIYDENGEYVGLL